MKRIFITLCILAACCIQAAGREGDDTKVIKGFSGGMMVHTGYVFGNDCPYVPINIDNATFGIGGVAKLQFTKHFRLGFEGYFSNAPLSGGLESGSYNKLFWTGALVDWFWKVGERLYPYAGVTVGGGMETAFFMPEGDKHSWEPKNGVFFHKQPFFAADPFVGVEYQVGAALRLTLKADWLLAVNSDGLNRPTGPRIYFGFIFAH